MRFVGEVYPSQTVLLVKVAVTEIPRPGATAWIAPVACLTPILAGV